MKNKLLLLFFFTIIGLPAIHAQSIKIGSSVNVEGLFKTSQSAVFTDPYNSIVGIIHRNDPSVFGGSSGHLKIARSFDGGMTWTTGLGPLNTTLTRTARFPGGALIRRSTNTSTSLIYQSVTLNSTPYANGYVSGISNISSNGSINTLSEEYFAMSASSRVSDFSGIKNRLANTTNGAEFWHTEFLRVNNSSQSATDSIQVYKGTYRSSPTIGIDFIKQFTLTPNNVTFGNLKRAKTPAISFSPDGQIGYIAYLGDIGICDSTFNIIYYKSFDGGVNWSGASEVRINSIVGARDSLTSLEFIVGGQTRKISQVGTDSEFDITVDSLGNLHLLTTLLAVEITENDAVLPAYRRNYVGYADFPKWIVDLHLTSSGNFACDHIARINKYKTVLTPVANFWPFTNYTLDNHPQIARSMSGGKLFYSWADTDPVVFPNAVNNDNPSIFISSKRLFDNFRTCTKKVTNITSANNVITPSMAEVVLEKVSVNPLGPSFTAYHLPIVYQQIITDAASSVDLHYAGNMARFCDQDYLSPGLIDFSSAGFCASFTSCDPIISGISSKSQSDLFSVSPNPSSTVVTINSKYDIRLFVYDAVGVLIKEQGMIVGEQALSLESFAPGLYILRAIDRQGNVQETKILRN